MTRESAFSFSIDQLSKHLERAERILFVTGAGISAESGLPTYRGIGGLYEDRHCNDEVPIEVALSGAMFQQRPEVTWRYILELERTCRGARHNQAHELIARFERHFEVCVLTQNVDGFHRDAGSSDVIEIHGNLKHLQCTRCGHGQEVVNYEHLDRLPPLCDECGGVIRPRVVLFGEWLPEPGVERFRDKLEQGFDLMVSVGTSALFPYIMDPFVAAKSSGTPTVEINPAETDLSSLVDFRLPTIASDALARLWRLIDT